MSREWNRGDVAMVRLDSETEIRIFFTNDGWRGTKGAFYDLHLSARPLVVIDPESSVDVEQLADVFCKARWDHTPGSTECDPMTFSSMQAALREFANPTPPKPYREAFVGSAPWPVVSECHSWNVAGHECPQCAWEHEHDWVAWTNAQGPSWPPNAVPIRCSKCGGRKCDADDCSGQRHRHKHDEVTP